MFPPSKGIFPLLAWLIPLCLAAHRAAQSADAATTQLSLFVHVISLHHLNIHLQAQFSTNPEGDFYWLIPAAQFALQELLWHSAVLPMLNGVWHFLTKLNISIWAILFNCFFVYM